jgi:hypothetical protein
MLAAWQPGRMQASVVGGALRGSAWSWAMRFGRPGVAPA